MRKRTTEREKNEFLFCFTKREIFILNYTCG